jgi:hypothetical protein
MIAEQVFLPHLIEVNQKMELNPLIPQIIIRSIEYYVNHPNFLESKSSFDYTFYIKEKINEEDESHMNFEQ